MFIFYKKYGHGIIFHDKWYLKQEKTKRLGKLTLIMSILITIFGAFNPISINLKLNILGLTERIEIYTIQIFMFILSYYYTFLEKMNDDFRVNISIDK